MRAIKSKLLAVLALVFMLAVGMGFLAMPKTTLAEEVPQSNFYIEDGASIRLVSGQNGIKWTAHITKTGADEILDQYGSSIVQVGIAIKPSGDAITEWEHYPYAGSVSFSESKTEIVYTYAIYYDDIIADIEDALKRELDKEEKENYLSQAYQMVLQAKPYAVLADKQVVYGDAYDTARSLQSVAMHFYLNGQYAGTDDHALLRSFLPKAFNEAPVEYQTNSFYSNYDAWGDIAIDPSIEIDKDVTIYYGAKDVTDLYNAEKGAVELAGIQTAVTEDGTANEYLVVYDAATTTAYKHYFTGVTLAIDEFSDMDYFKVKEQAYFVSNVYTFAEGDFEWDGYYVLLNDIDGKNASFSTSNGKISTNKTTINAGGKLSGRSGTQIESSATGCGLKANGEYVKGLTGTFDGRGYAIKNIKIPGEDGLFGIVVGTGVIKNTAFISVGSTTRSSIAAVIAGGATMKDCYVEYISTAKPYMGGSVTFDKIGNKAHIENVVLNVNFTNGLEPTVRGYAQWYSLFGNTVDEVFSDVYAISNIAVMNNISNTAGSTWYAGRDAALVDGVESGVATTYQNIKRYTTAEKMSADKANNDFSSWNSDVWVIKNGVPTFNSNGLGEYSVLVDGEPVAQEGYSIYTGEQLNVTINHGGAACENSYTLQVTDGDAVTVNGNVITAVKKGAATVTVLVGSSKLPISVNVADVPTDFETEYQFSAYDGLFFDGANVVSTKSIINELTELGDLQKVLDSEDNELVYDTEKDAILGLDLGEQDDWKETYFTFVGSEKSYYVHVKAADAIIDEVKDLKIFTISGVPTAKSTSLTYAGDDFTWDGYFVMVKDIDCAGYDHALMETTGFAPNTPSIATVAKTNFGLTGTFDGQGHVISNYSNDNFAPATGQGASSGLFTYINGGTVKNVAFVAASADSHDNADGPSNVAFLATYVCGDAVIQDVYVDVEDIPGGFGACAMIYRAQATVTMNRVMMQYRGGGYNAGDYTGFIGSTTMPSMTDCYIISEFTISTGSRTDSTAYRTQISTGKQTTGRHKLMAVDAKYVDGVENTTATANFFTSGNATKYYFTDYTLTVGETVYSAPTKITLVDGLKRYSAAAKMTSDAKNNNFDVFNNGYWEIIDGIPQFRNMISSDCALYLNGEVVDTANTYEQFVGDELTFTVNYNGKSLVGTPSIVALNNKDKVSINGNVVELLAKGTDTVLAITYGGKTWNVNVNITKAIDFETEYQFSNYDGLFFDGANVVSVQSLIEEFTELGNLVKVVDADGNELTYDAEAGTILGATIDNSTTWEETYISFVGDDSVIYNVHVDAATLIIDEATDLTYFQIKKPAGKDYNNHTADLDPTDFVWDGYYAMVKDINFEQEGYVHDFKNGSALSWGARDYNSCLTRIGTTHGLTGTFDGQGFSLIDMTFKATVTGEGSAEGGLFGWINGGTLKNLGIISPAEGNIGGGGVLAFSSTNANYEDLYIYHDTRYSNYGTIFWTNSSSGATFTRCLFNIPYQRYHRNGYFMPAGATFVDTYMIHTQPTFVGGYDTKATYQSETATSASGATFRNFTYDAAYVDGKPAPATSKIFVSANNWGDTYSLDKYTIVYNGVTYERGTSYDIKLINGLKRYTTTDTMTADASNNDFSSWNNGYWEIVDGIPRLKSRIAPSVELFVNGNSVDENTVYEQQTGDKMTFTVKYNAKDVSAPSIVATSDSKAFSINGNVVEIIDKTANGTLAVTYGGRTWTVNIMAAKTIDVETEYQFSAYDGLLFDGENKVNVADFIAEFVELGNLVAVLDANGNELTYNPETGTILGLTINNSESYEQTYISFVGDNAVIYNVYVDAATLIIDEASDFEYFSLKKDAGVLGGDNTAYIAPGDMEFGGYYVLAKDINFEQEGYAHDFYNGQVVAWGARGYSTAARYIGTTHGLTGTFDGNGHTITDITFENTATSGNSFEAGLFGWLNGGTIKNTAFVSPDEGDLNGGGIFGWAVKGSVLFQDCYFYFDNYYGNYGVYQFACSSMELATFTRCYMEIKDTNVTHNARGGFIDAKPNFEDSYFVFSHSAFLSGYGSYTGKASEDSASVSLGTLKRVIADAAFVDGVANVATCDRFYTATRWDHSPVTLKDYTITTGSTVYEKGSTYDITLFDGLQRYTSKAKMATVENDFSNWDPSIWTIVDGAPVFISSLQQSEGLSYK